MDNIIASLQDQRPHKWKKRGLLTAAFLVGASALLAPMMLETGVVWFVETAKTEIADCTINGVGAAIANGTYTLTLPTGCRLAG